MTDTTPEAVERLAQKLVGWDHCWPARWLEGATVEAAATLRALSAEVARLTAPGEPVTQTPPEDVGAVARAAETLRLDQRAITELVMHQFRHRAHATAGEIDRRRKKMDACLAALAKGGRND